MAKKKSGKAAAGDLFNYIDGSYLERTSRPIYALMFLLPFILFYEFGTIFINTDVLNQSQVRVVAFVWLQEFLMWLGFGGKFVWAAPAFAVVLILTGLQFASKKKWNVWLTDFLPMAIECVLFAIPLIVLSLFMNGTGGASFAGIGTGLTVCAGAMDGHLMADIVTGIGAGIYEELLFRLILIAFFMIVFQDVLRLSQRHSIIFSIVISAALFSMHHHIIFLHGQFGQSTPFSWIEFTFRTMAGVYFAVLYASRGFGITAGTHAFYDIIAVVMNAIFFKG